VLWWRAVGSTHTAYAVETFLDELAAAAGRDPVEFRLDMLQGSPRHAAVLKMAAEKAGWGAPLPAGRFRGVAVAESFGTVVAQVAELTVGKAGAIKVERVVCAVDCGTAITSPLFSTIANHVDSLVVVSSQAPDGLNGAWTTIQWLQAHGFARLLPRTVIALNSTFKNKPLVDLDDAEQEFTAKIPGVSVVRIPYDVHLAEGRDVTFVELKSRARKALMALAGAIAQHYPARGPHQHRTTETGGF